MPPLDFPNTPTNGTTFTGGLGAWIYDGAKWNPQAATSGFYLPLSGGTMTGPIVLAADPTTALQAATKQYVDAHAGSGGGGVSVTISDTAPASPVAGSLWWDSVGGQLYISYTDPNSTEWVIANSGAVGSYLALSGGTLSGPLTVPSLTITTTPLSVASGGTGQATLAAQAVLTGAGTSGIVANTHLTFDGTILTLNNNTGITAPTNQGQVHVIAADGNNATLTLDTYGGQAFIQNRAARGTATSPAALQTGDLMTCYNSVGHDGTAFGFGGNFSIAAAENWTTSAHGTRGQIYTMAKGSTGGTYRIAVEQGLMILNGSGANPTGNDLGPGTINAASGIHAGDIIMTGGSNAGFMFLDRGTATDQWVWYATGNSTAGLNYWNGSSGGDLFTIAGGSGNASFHGNIGLSGTNVTVTAPVGGWPSFIMVKPASGIATQIIGSLGTVSNYRWIMSLGAQDAESGSNTGSSFIIGRYSDTGAWLDNPVQIYRATGITYFTTSVGIGSLPPNDMNQSILVNGGLVTTGGGWSAGVYWAGSWKYLVNGYGAVIAPSNGSFYFYSAPSGTAGAAASLTNIATIDSGGNAAFIGHVSCQTTGGTPLYVNGLTADSHISLYHNNRSWAICCQYSAISANAYLIYDYTANASRFMIDVNGTCYNTQGTWNTFSDARLKHSVTSYDRGLDAILALDPIRFRYIAGKASLADDREHIGFAAEAVEKVMPELVGRLRTQINNDDEEDTEILTMAPTGVVFALVNAVKELAAKNAVLEARLTQLETR